MPKLDTMPASRSTVEVALPVPFRHTFTYGVPPALAGQIQWGSRVVAPFRKRRIVGIVTALESQATFEADIEVKPIVKVLEGESVLSEALYALCVWVADFYFAPIGEVLRTACPLAFVRSTRQFVSLSFRGRKRLEAKQKFPRSTDLFEEGGERSCEKRLLQEIASQEEVDLRYLQKQCRDSSFPKVLDRLQASGEIQIRTKVSEHAMTERKEAVVRLSPAIEPAGLKVRLSAGQRKILEHLQRQSSPLRVTELSSLLNISPATVQTLAKRKLVVVDQVKKDRIPIERSVAAPGDVFRAAPLIRELTPDQKRALRIIGEAIQREKFSTILLFGVTASGKTEVYLRAIERVLESGGTALLLVPEIALTPSAAQAFAARFGGHVAILHSGLSEGERHDEWWRIKRGEARVVVGTRSAVFAPLENLRLIVVDEEHEGSYKQQESPRYHGRDVAVMRAKMTGAVIVLGSATPSMESFYNAQRGKYQLVALENRVASRALARVTVVDMRQEFAESKKYALLSQALTEAIESRLHAQEQVLVLLNRRGFSSFVLCRSCGGTRQCPHCSITMTYHKRRHILLCHYCASAASVPKECWQCGSEHLYFVGGGTEQIEEKVREAFPPARVARLDRDTVQGREGFHRILGEFREGTTDILVGTQMIAKGHDFPRVTLAGVLNADGALGFPDFRAAERTFQLLTQVAGRSGRGAAAGEVILQAYYPEHYAIQFAARQDFIGFFNKEIHFRRMMHYPPFVKQAVLGIRHQKFEEAMRIAKALGEYLRSQSAPEVRVLGPAIAPLARLKNEYRWHLLLKSTRRPSLKQMIERCLSFCETQKISEPHVLIDVDPTNLM